MNPVVAKKAMTVWQDAYPSRCSKGFLLNSDFQPISCRPKAIHFVNMPPVIESVFRMMQVSNTWLDEGVFEDIQGVLRKIKVQLENDKWCENTGPAKGEDASAEPRPSKGWISTKTDKIMALNPLLQGDMSAVLADLGPEVETILCSKKWRPNQVLPPEYGGTGSTVEELTKYWMDQVRATFFWVPWKW